MSPAFFAWVVAVELEKMVEEREARLLWQDLGGEG